MNKQTNKDIMKAYKKKNKHRHPVESVQHYDYNKYEVYLFVTGILLLYCAPTISFGIIKGRSIVKIIVTSLLTIIVSISLNFLAVLPWLGTDNHQAAPGNVVLGLMFMCSYGIQIAINMM